MADGLIFYGVEVSKDFMDDTGLSQSLDHFCLIERNKELYWGFFVGYFDSESFYDFSSFDKNESDANFLEILDRIFEEKWGDAKFKRECYEELLNLERKLLAILE